MDDDTWGWFYFTILFTFENFSIIKIQKEKGSILHNATVYHALQQSQYTVNRTVLPKHGACIEFITWYTVGRQ